MSHFYCQACNAKLKWVERLAGKDVPCPKCNAPLSVPYTPAMVSHRPPSLPTSTPPPDPVPVVVAQKPKAVGPRSAQFSLAWLLWLTAGAAVVFAMAVMWVRSDSETFDFADVVGLVLVFIGYWLPSIIAWLRGHHQLGPIIIVNFLTGWTVILWLLALIWSVSWIRQGNLRDPDSPTRVTLD